MMLVTPPLDVSIEDGFSNDIFNRKNFGVGLMNIIQQSEDALVISLDGEWGEGKTTFVKMWQGLLYQNSIHSIYIDAFTNDYTNDPFIAVASSIIAYEKEFNTQNNTSVFFEKAKKVAGKVIPWAAKLGVKALTLNVVDNQQLENIEKDLAQTASDVTGAFTHFIGEKLNSHQEDIAAIKEFHNSLSKLPSQLPPINEQAKKSPLIIIIDELDRCRPTFAIELLEKVKHLFSVQNIVFVLVMNKQQLEQSISCIYGNIDANAYLQKFINIEMQLPKLRDPRKRSDEYYYEYRNHLVNLHKMHNIGDVFNELPHFAAHFQLSIRQFQRIFSSLALFHSSMAKKEYACCLVCYIAIVKVLNPKLFNILVYRESDSLQKLNEYLNVNMIIVDSSDPNVQDIVYYKQYLEFATLSEAEYTSLPEESPIKSKIAAHYEMRTPREKIIFGIIEKFNMFILR